jgi:CubicO group peptidase (beta-lactamase class C family)
MKKILFTMLIMAALTGVASLEVRAQLQLGGGSQLNRIPNPLFLSALSNKLDARLKSKSVGYAYAIVDQTGNVVGGGGGEARRAPDSSPRKMTWDDKLNIASVSKTITAAAVLKLLNQKRMSVDLPVHPFLPINWTLGANIKTITFRELLTHRAGLRCPKEVTYLNLRECLAAGIVPANKSTQVYNNSNFALFRLIIPRLNGFDGGNTADNAIGNSIASATYATAYANYVRNNILAPAGLSGIDLKPVATNPALCYQFPTPKQSGESFGDMTETSASRGWNMSARQLAILFHALFQTEKVFPFHVSKKMKAEQLGVWKDASFGTNSAFEHGGFYPGAQNKGELNSYGVSFANGVSVAVIVNSQFGPGQSVATEVKAAMKELVK